MVHLGHNIAKLRGLRRMAQKEIANKLEMSQQEYSKVEQSAEVDDIKLKIIAEALGVSMDAIKNFNDETAINVFNTNNVSDHGNANNIVGNNATNNFNPMEKYIEVVEENKKLYQQLLREKDALIEMLQQQVKGK